MNMVDVTGVMFVVSCVAFVVLMHERTCALMMERTLIDYILNEDYRCRDDREEMDQHTLQLVKECYRRCVWVLNGIE